MLRPISNHSDFSRRAVIAGAGLLALSACSAQKKINQVSLLESKIAQLEKQAGGRLGAFILDTATGRSIAHRADERFGMCSTFKLSLAAAILQMADAGKLQLDTILPYSKADLVSNSSVTTQNVASGGMAIEALAKAVQLTSDNAAANILMKHIGGPATLTAFWRSLGDNISRADRYETELNLVPAGEVRDTTSPQAIARSTAKFLTSDTLLPASREKLIGWMAETKTGAKRIRAGLPPLWRQGDKTGTGTHESYGNKYNDIAIFWPPVRPPVIVTCFYEGPVFSKEIRDVDQAVLAEVGRIAAAQSAEWAGGFD